MKNFNFKQGTQKQVLYDYLLTGKSITTKGAMIDLGIADLQGCIRNLKEAGVLIETIDQKVHTRYTKKDGSPKYAYVREYKLETIFESNTHTIAHRTPEEQLEWDQWEGENPFPEDLVERLERKHKESHSGNCSILNKDVGTVNTTNDWLDRIK